MTNPYCEVLGIEVPRLEVVKERREANTFALLITAILERGSAMTLAEAAERFASAGVAPVERALVSLRRCRPGRAPVYRDGELYELDPHDAELDLWLFRLGLRPPKFARIEVIRSDASPRPEPHERLRVAELDEAWSDASLSSWPVYRITLAVLDAVGKPMTPEDVVAFVAGRTRWHWMKPDSTKFKRRGSPVSVRDDGTWSVAPDGAQLRPTREAVRDRIEVVRRQASMHPDPVVVRAHGRAVERQRVENACEVETMHRVLVHAFPHSTPEVVVLLDMSQRDIRAYTRDDIGEAIARLADYEIIAGVGVRPLLRALRYRHELEQRLAELAPPQKTMKINQRGRLLKISNELLITSTCRISRPLGDAKILRDYLRNGMHARLLRRMEADAKSLFALYGYGRLHGFVRVCWGFVNEHIPAPWAYRDETKLYDLKRQAHERGRKLEVVAGHAPSWTDPWARALWCDVEEEPYQHYAGLLLVDEDGLMVEDDDVQLARLADGDDSPVPLHA